MVAASMLALARHGPAAAAQVAQSTALEPEEEMEPAPRESTNENNTSRMILDPPDLLSMLHLPSSARTPILQEALKAYPNYVASDLAHLDELRYATIPTLLQTQTHLTKADLLNLMDWKLGHGKHRPALRGLINQNSDELVVDVTRRGIELLRDKPEDIKAQLKVLQELKGVGPATASLILSCADPEGAVFFGDEVYEWVCPKPGEKIKYTVKEYVQLWESVREIKVELGLSAVEIEKVGYVFGKRLAEHRPDRMMVVKIEKEQGGDKNAADTQSMNEAKRPEDRESGKRKADQLDDDKHEETAAVTGNEGTIDKEESRKKIKVKESMQGTRKSTRSKKT